MSFCISAQARKKKVSFPHISGCDFSLHVRHILYQCDHTYIYIYIQLAPICGVITMHVEAIKILKDEMRLCPEMSELHLIHLKSSFSTSFIVAYSPFFRESRQMRSEREILMQTTGRSSGGRERQTKEVNEKERESTERCVICILPTKALIPIQSTFMRPAVRTSYYCWPESKILSEGGREAVLNRKRDLGLRLLRCQPPTVFCLTEFIQS